MAENILWFIAFIQERILAYNTNATGMKDQPSALGERKRMQRRDLDLELLFIKHSMANAVQDVLDAFEYRVLSWQNEAGRSRRGVCELKEKVVELRGIWLGSRHRCREADQNVNNRHSKLIEWTNYRYCGLHIWDSYKESVNIIPVVKKVKWLRLWNLNRM